MFHIKNVFNTGIIVKSMALQTKWIVQNLKTCVIKFHYQDQLYNCESKLYRYIIRLPRFLLKNGHIFVHYFVFCNSEVPASDAYSPQNSKGSHEQNCHDRKSPIFLGYRFAICPTLRYDISHLTRSVTT